MWAHSGCLQIHWVVLQSRRTVNLRNSLLLWLEKQAQSLAEELLYLIKAATKNIPEGAGVKGGQGFTFSAFLSRCCKGTQEHSAATAGCLYQQVELPQVVRPLSDLSPNHLLCDQYMASFHCLFKHCTYLQVP